MLGGDQMTKASRTPDIMADAAYGIFMCDNDKVTGNFFIDENVLRLGGLNDFNKY